MFPKATLERLKLYHTLLQEEKNEYISSDEIARKLSIKPEQVRKDITYLDYSGKPKVGYHVSSLLDTLDELFGTKVTDNIIIVGAGHLGKALANYDGFENYGISVVAIFDNNPEKLGTYVGELVVLPLDDLGRVIRRFNVKIGTICVPGESAQKIADLLIKKGIKAIWNFAPVILEVPEGILVENEDIARSALTLKHLLDRTPTEKI
ncbi:redox-sensing transcriptional repressor Rex [Kosmotoga arenicorallina]|nr:redox-sensing transcriptional repressor Rex [Kosmotoga arenicorallina]